MTEAQEPQFIHLHVHSAYSLAEGAIRTNELVDLCQRNNMPATAVTDTNNMFGALEFAMAATKGGVQPIIGCQVKIGDDKHQLVLLAQSEEGYRNLCRLISDAFMDTEDSVSDPHVTWEELYKYHTGLICLTGGLAGPVAQHLLHGQQDKADDLIQSLQKTFGDRLYIEIQRHHLAEEDKVEDGLIDLAYKHNIPLVATNDCYFATRDMHEAHDALLCIADGAYVIEQNRRTVTPDHYFKSQTEMVELFSDLPEAVQNTVAIAKRCSFLLKPIDPILPPFATEGGRSEVEELKAQSEEGLQWRLDNFVFEDGMTDAEKEEAAKPYRERLGFELETIVGMGFPGYFLIVADFIQWAKDHDIPVGPGRGSGAGSVVAWALKITDLDPLRFNLLFERFLNPERVSMPDFDVDFCQDKRDEVIRYVQDKYGHDHVAQIITFGKLQARAVVRDVGRVLQMPYGQVDRIAKMIPNNPASPTTLQEALDADPDLEAERHKDDTTAKLIDIALKLEGLYRHASTHAAGVVIGDRPLHELIPLYRDPRSDMPVTQFNMKYVEQAGLVKFDFLGLKTLTVIQKSVELIKHTTGEDIDILQIPFEDDQTFDMLSKGDTTAVFQLESAGMRDLCRQMKLSNFEQIIALVALFRPGPMENIPKYLACLNGREERDYMHPKLQPILEETYGIMIYQEQVMQAAQVLSGYTLGGADLLRRAMGKKIQEAMDEEREKFVKGAIEASQVDGDQANYIFDQIAKFAGYGFNKAHSAGYALVAYWTAWLKANYPVEFMAATMTLDMGNTDKLSILKQELDRMQIPLHPPDVNRSFVEFAPEEDEHSDYKQSIRYALAALKGVGSQAMSMLVQERKDNGEYKDLYDLASRLNTKVMNKKAFEMLACAGAFDNLNPSREQCHAATEILLRYSQMQAEERESGQNSLFGGEEAVCLSLPELPKVEEWEPLERLRHEFDAVGFYLSAHPLDSKEPQLRRMTVTPVVEVPEKLAHTTSLRIQMAGIVIKKQEKVSAKSGNKFAFVQLSDSTGIFEAMAFSEVLGRYRDLMTAGNAVLVTMDVEQKDDQIRYTIQSVSDLEQEAANVVEICHVYMDETEKVDALKSILDQGGEGTIRVHLHVSLSPEQQVEMRLPGRYTISPEDRTAIRRTDGVYDVRDF